MIDTEDFIIVEETRCKRKYFKCYCNNCGESRGYQRKNRAQRPLGKCCFGSVTHKDKLVSKDTRKKQSENSWIKKNPEKHPMLGRKVSEELKIRLSQKQREHCARHGNQFVTGKSQGKHSADTISRISRKNSGKDPKWKGRVFQYSGPKGNIKMRSSYELAYAHFLDSNGIKWEYEPRFTLSDGRSFSPDFKLCSGVIIEIKGYWTKIGHKKWQMFCDEYPKINKKVLMKADLQKLGVI